MEAEAERVADLSRMAAEAAASGAAANRVAHPTAGTVESELVSEASGRAVSEAFDSATMYERFFPSPVHGSKQATDAAYDDAVSGTKISRHVEYQSPGPKL